jgi:hypothetical protein
VELIGGETAHTYLQTYITQSKHGSRGMSPAIQSNQDVHMCGPKICGLSENVVVVAHSDDGE